MTSACLTPPRFGSEEELLPQWLGALADDIVGLPQIGDQIFASFFMSYGNGPEVMGSTPETRLSSQRSNEAENER